MVVTLDRSRPNRSAFYVPRLCIGHRTEVTHADGRTVIVNVFAVSAEPGHVLADDRETNVYRINRTTGEAYIVPEREG